ncbi:hypothetical protein RCH14_004507 [Massilia sp. MP_M2]|uniref:hypothetical protein n=1 Tax=Massilia sp. MP_M2 TaxID=3071713 RepID=UPI00319DB53D
MLEQFKPDMRIVAVDGEQALVTFDSGAAYDLRRSPVALRIPRNFASLKLEVVEVVEVPDGKFDSKRVYRGAIKLHVKCAADTQIYDLADFDLLIAAVGKPRRGLPPSDFPPASAVTVVIRQGAADALSRALEAFSAKEGEVAVLQRLPVGAYSAPTQVVAAGPSASMSMPSFVRSAIGNRNAANDTPADGKNFRKQMLAAAVLTPLIVVGFMWALSNNKPADPIHDAVAQAMVQNPAAAQAQVELTKATLKEMGLDPGAAGDTGCLAAQ